jgi:hypothetical protein
LFKSALVYCVSLWVAALRLLVCCGSLRCGLLWSATKETLKRDLREFKRDMSRLWVRCWVREEGRVKVCLLLVIVKLVFACKD